VFRVARKNHALKKATRIRRAGKLLSRRSIGFFCIFTALHTGAWSKTFNLQTDTCSFSNQTYFDYKTATDQQIIISRRKGKVPDYSRHCFQLCRAVLQFDKFAEFRPDLPEASESEYQRLVRRISRIPAWSSGPKEKIIIPGYRNLDSFSSAHALTLQKNLGLWWPSYLRIGNWRIVFPVPRSSQARMAQWLRDELDNGRIRTVYITRFKPLNHCLVVYHYDKQPNGDLVFLVYDSNQPKKVVHLTYRTADRSFYYDRTWYYRGGLVSVLTLYVSPIF
jgi:hypothetical protein